MCVCVHVCVEVAGRTIFELLQCVCLTNLEETLRAVRNHQSQTHSFHKHIQTCMSLNTKLDVSIGYRLSVLCSAGAVDLKSPGYDLLVDLTEGIRNTPITIENYFIIRWHICTFNFSTLSVPLTGVDLHRNNTFPY